MFGARALIKRRAYPMRKYLMAGAAALVIAAPAAATNDNSGYVGLEGGILFPRSQSVSGDVVFTTPATGGPTNFTTTSIGNQSYKKGLDLDFVGGYDFGMFRLEGELGYKHAKVKSFGPSNAFVTAINTGAGTTFVSTDDFGLADSASVYSGMVNALLDFGGNGGIGGYVGAGAGYANVKQFGDSHGGSRGSSSPAPTRRSAAMSISASSTASSAGLRAVRRRRSCSRPEPRPAERRLLHSPARGERRHSSMIAASARIACSQA